jgi:hypothetical protein
MSVQACKLARSAGERPATKGWWERLHQYLPAADLPDVDPWRSPWWWAAMGAAAIVGTLIGVFLASIPLQLSDMLANLLLVQRSSWSEFLANLAQLKPRSGLWATLKFFFDMAHGHYFFVFKALHVAMVLASLLLAVRLMQVKTPIDFTAAAIAVYMTVGMHTFLGLINEGFPINNHLTPVLGALIAANLAYSRGGIVVDIAAVACFVLVAMTVETGFLIPVILVVAYLLGWRGVSRPALGIIGLLLFILLVARTAQFGEAGALINTGSGFGFSHHEASELRMMFSGKMYVFFLYNVFCALLSVILSEPQGGAWVFVRDLLAGDLLFYQIAEVASSALLAALIVLYAFRRWRAWAACDLDHGDRLVLVAFPILAANAAISFAYSKNVILGTAGVFWALAGFAAIRAALSFAAGPSVQPMRAILATIIVASISYGFVVRTVSAHVRLHSAALTTQVDWVESLERQPGYQPESAEERALIQQLKAGVLTMPVPPKEILPRWLLRLESR